MEKAALAATGETQDSPQHRLDAARHGRAEVIPERLAVITGGNKGVGLEVCRQLACQGVTVILTARDEKREKDAAEFLRSESKLPNIIFHQLDVRDDNSVTSLAQYIESTYGKLDILVNNAAVSGIVAYEEGLKALNMDAETWTSGRAAKLLKELSTSGARIVNASSLVSELKRMPNEKLRNDLSNISIWDEDRIEAVLNTFLEDLKNGRLEEAGWLMMLPTYTVLKMFINLYTRIMARRYPKMRINCVRPGFVKTDISWGFHT
ncbi:hypothetical protein PAHAL_2G492900 [Panicum hallii]|uniref:(+)-neomenthol dehydrogenase n=1 Tax=Panicum hallii TaxID=206008 RepID=A0A2S3H591_9POAL|nr:(+)-neomenthol dehydrogenase-like isoform X2 [Panicum hallii]PAN15506.1 hypothetical protein PAHAL_2G492900 [Panicum hallii]